MESVENVVDSDIEEAFSCTPPDILQKAEATTSTLLPEKSKCLYDKMYRSFMDWRIKKKTTSFSENVLLAYFAELGEKYKSSSLWSYYSMLKSVLILKHNVNMEKYSKLRSFLKRKSEGYQAKKSETLTPEEIKKFISEAPDEIYLLHKVIVIVNYKYF